MIQSHWGMITKLTCPGLVAMLRSGCAAGWFSMENLPLYTGKPEKTKRGLRSEVQMALLSFLWCKSLKIKQRQQVLTQASFLFRGTDITPFSVSRTEGKLRVVFVLNQHQPWFSFFQLGWHRCYCDSLPPELRDRRVAKILPASSVSKPSQQGLHTFPHQTQAVPSAGTGTGLTPWVWRVNVDTKALWIFLSLPSWVPPWAASFGRRCFDPGRQRCERSLQILTEKPVFPHT